MRGKTKAKKRKWLPDPVYGDVLISRFINRLMIKGKRSVAEKIFYTAFDLIREKTNKDPRQVFEKAMKNVMPEVEVRSHRVGGATYQVPIEVRDERKHSLTFRWLINYSRSRPEKTMSEKLANEIMEAEKGQGSAVKKKEETHRMADANKAFAHFRW